MTEAWSGRYSFSLVACARWEEDAIVEWIEYHRAIGVDHFYIYSNDDSPWPLQRVLMPYLMRDEPIVTYRHWPFVGEQPQIYFHFLENFKHETEWFSFLDIDEFLVFRRLDSVSSFLAPFRPDFDAVYLNWTVFGNDDYVKRQQASLLISHTRRSAKVDAHTKVLTRSAAIDAKYVRARHSESYSPFWHFWNDFDLDPARITNVLGDRIDDYAEGFPRAAYAYLDQPGISERMLDKAFVAHFQFKSEEDFIRRGERGGFSNDTQWAKVFADGSYRALLARFNEVSDTYLVEFWAQRMSGKGETAAFQPIAEPSLPNVALNKPSWQSSRYAGPTPPNLGFNEGHGNNGFRTGGFGFHTEFEKEPWWKVDLLREHAISEVRVYNRLGSPGVAERAGNIAIEISLDGEIWFEVFSNAGRPFNGIDGAPLMMKFDPPLSGRYVRIISRSPTILHLDEIEIYGTSAACAVTAESGRGMWIDRSDFEVQLRKRVRDGRVPPRLEQPLREFERDGFYVLEGAASESDLDRFEEAISKAFREGHEHLMAQEPGLGASKRVFAGMSRRRIRVIDSFTVFPEALNLLSSPRLAEFLRAVFDETPMLFQSLSFDMGSEQGMHQDTAYVVVDKRPLELMACSIALEDVQTGAGELEYIVGSHRLGDFPFGGGSRKHLVLSEDGDQKHEEWYRWILEESQRRGLERRKFMAKRGDILLWHADLAYGGAPVLNQDLTCRSLVGHYCPFSATPHFMTYALDRTTKKMHRDIAYSSGHYDLQALSTQDMRDFFTKVFG